MAQNLNKVGDQVSTVGRHLKHWRRVRGLSQLDLALAANVSARHVSFIETGRAQPSRGMLRQLCTAMDVPFRDRNVILTAAGLAADYPERDIDHPALGQALQALEYLLDAHDPYPAIVVDRLWNLRMANRGATILMRLLQPTPSAQPASNLLRLVFDDGGMRPFIVNWEEIAEHLLHRLHTQATAGDQAAQEMLQEMIAENEGLRQFRHADRVEPPTPLLSMHIRNGDMELRLFGTITSFGTPQDLTLQELRIESFFPADDVTKEALRQIAAL